MTGDAVSVDELLRAATGDPRPSSEIIDRGRRMLVAAIHAEGRREAAGIGRHRTRRLGWAQRAVIAAGAVAMVVVLAVAGIVATPDQATALGQLAEVAETYVTPVPVGGELLFTSTVQTALMTRNGSDLGAPEIEVVSYLLPIVRSSWSDGITVHEEVTVGQPIFFDGVAAAAYQASNAGLEDRIGETTVAEFPDVPSDIGVRDWPTDTDDLREAMIAYVATEGTTVSQSAQVVRLSASLLREGEAPPELRAAVLRVLDTLDDVVVTDDGSTVIVAVDYVDEGVAYRSELEFDEEARLRQESIVWPDGDPALGVPPGTRVEQQVHAPAVVVGSLDAP